MKPLEFEIKEKDMLDYARSGNAVILDDTACYNEMTYINVKGTYRIKNIFEVMRKYRSLIRNGD